MSTPPTDPAPKPGPPPSHQPDPPADQPKTDPRDEPKFSQADVDRIIAGRLAPDGPTARSLIVELVTPNTACRGS